MRGKEDWVLYTTCEQSTDYSARWRMRLATVLSPAYTFPGGEPSMRETMASRAILIFWNDPRMCIFLQDINHSVSQVGFRMTETRVTHEKRAIALID